MAGEVFPIFPRAGEVVCQQTELERAAAGFVIPVSEGCDRDRVVVLRTCRISFREERLSLFFHGFCSREGVLQWN